MKTRSTLIAHALRTLGAVVFLTVAVGPAAAQQYSIIDLGPGTAQAINAQAYVTGSVGPNADAFRFDGVTYLSLSSPAFLAQWGTAINDQNDVAGYGRRTGEQNITAFVYRESTGSTQALGTLPGHSQSFAYGIGNSGKVVGESSSSSSSGSWRAFLWTPGIGMQDLGTLNGLPTIAYAINDADVVVGEALNGGSVRRAFRWTATTGMQDLGTLGGLQSRALAINRQGNIAGDVLRADGTTHAFLYRNGLVQDLGTLPGGTYSQALGINDLDQVVGVVASGATVTERAFLYSDGVMRDLNSLLPLGTGWRVKIANDIDDHGGIVGQGELNGVQQRAFLMIPTALQSFAVSPSTVPGGSSPTGQISLTDPVHLGVVVFLSSNSPSVTVPSYIRLPQDVTSFTFPVSTAAVTNSTSAVITATLGNVSKTFTLTLNPPSSSPATLTNLTLNPSSVTGGANVTGTLALSGPAPGGGATVAISENNAAASAPSSVTVPAGMTSATFRITTSLTNTVQVGTVTARYGTSVRTATLTVNPIGVATLTLAPNPVKGGSPVTGTVTLDTPAPTGGIVVALASSHTNVARPAVGSVSIPAGKVNGTFSINTSAVRTATSVSITARANGVGKSVALFVTP